MEILLPPYVEAALARLTGKGFLAHAVGGCVRDSLLQKSPSDWDLCSSALPNEIMEVFSDCTTVPSGLAHGTVTVIVEGTALEITTFRRDGEYSDHRRPERVEFTPSLTEDLRRRDFTVNAMAYSREEGLRDPFGGLEDLEMGVIRCVGSPRERFKEDALRILRALRFSAVLGFRIETKTAAAMEELSPSLSFVSAERKGAELKRLLMGPKASMALVQNPKLLFEVIPALKPTLACTQEGPYHCHDVFMHTMEALESAPKNLRVRLAVLLHDMGKPSCKTLGPEGRAHFYGHVQVSARMAEEALQSLRFDKKTTKEVCELILYHGEALPLSEKRIKKLLVALGDSRFHELLQVMEADLRGQAPRLLPKRLPLLHAASEEAQKIKEREDCLTLFDLAVNGDDLQRLGYLPGKELGEALDRLLERVLSGELPNSPEALLRALSK